MLKSKKSKIIVGILALVILISLVVTAFALLSDSSNKNAKAKAGLVDIDQTDVLIEKDFNGGIFGPNLDKWNPGDRNKFKWDVTNNQNKSVDTRHKIRVYWDVPLADDIREFGTMYIYTVVDAAKNPRSYASIMADIAAGANNAVTKVDTTVYTTAGGSRKGYEAVVLGDTLAGTGSSPENAASDSSEVGNQANDGSTTSDHLEYYIVFDPNAPRSLMGTPFKIDVITEAKQHRNTSTSDWSIFN